MVAVSQGHAGREARQQPALTAPPEPTALASYTLSSTFPAMRTRHVLEYLFGGELESTFLGRNGGKSFRADGEVLSFSRTAVSVFYHSSTL